MSSHSHQESPLPQYEADTTGKNKRSNPSAPQRALHILQRVLSVITSTSFTLTPIAAIIFSPLLEGDNDLQSMLLQCASSYLFILHPLLSTLSVCLQSSSFASVQKCTQENNCIFICTGNYMQSISEMGELCSGKLHCWRLDWRCGS